jgi:hypothetical protein
MHQLTERLDDQAPSGGAVSRGGLEVPEHLDVQLDLSDRPPPMASLSRPLALILTGRWVTSRLQ